MNTAPKPLILIVDDDDVQSLALKKALEKHNYHVELLDSGKKCLDYVQHTKPDAILLDILMPEMDGISVLNEIRKIHNANELPVFMATAKSNDEDVIAALKLHANDYFIKPIQFEVAQARIETHLKLSELSRCAQENSKFRAISTMIATYNHEVNNPLAIAIGILQSMKSSVTESERDSMMKAEKALWEISSIMKKIQNLKEEQSVSTESYSDQSNVYKLGE